MIDTLFDKINNFLPEKWRWVLSHEGFRKYFKNTGWMFFARMLSLIVSFLTTAFVARRLGPGNYGQLSYAVSFVGLFSFIATMGLDQVLFRDLIKYPERKNTFLGSTFIVKVIAGIFAMVLCLNISFFSNNDGVSRLLVFIISSTFLFNSFQIIIYEFQAKIKSKYPSIISLLVTLILSTLKILIVVYGRGVIYLAFVLLLESVLYAVFFVIIYKTKLGESIFSWKYNGKVARRLIRDSWPMIFASAFALIYARIDQVMIKHMINTESVGLYDAAVRLSEAWYFIPNIIVSSLFPAIINAKISSEVRYNERLRRLALLLFFLSIGVAAPTTVLAPFIINLLYGEAFSGSTIILQIYIWSGVGVSLGAFFNSYLVAENFRKILFSLSFITMASNILLNLLLIPQYGIVGSAWATFVSYILGPVCLMFFRTTRHKFLDIVRC